MILLPPCPECWNYRHSLPCLPQMYSLSYQEFHVSQDLSHFSLLKMYYYYMCLSVQCCVCVCVYRCAMHSASVDVRKWVWRWAFSFHYEFWGSDSGCQLSAPSCQLFSPLITPFPFSASWSLVLSLGNYGTLLICDEMR